MKKESLGYHRTSRTQGEKVKQGIQGVNGTKGEYEEIGQPGNVGQKGEPDVNWLHQMETVLICKKAIF